MSKIEMAKVSAEGSVGLDLAFRNLSYAVRLPPKKKSRCGPTPPGETKTILDNLSGVCKAGRLLAIMGPSGAGKTSLLDILAGRKLCSEGRLALGANDRATGADIRNLSAYVQQDDAIMASQTVREAVAMAAMLTLPREASRTWKMEQVAKVMKLFHLEGCADTLVGDPIGRLKGISGGERKRCAVAMSAVREPQIFFLDEPTSGLDAYKAYTLVNVLKELAAANNATIVCTIHQPSSDIFALFDDLMLLLDGQMVFAGNASEAVVHFGSAGFPCPEYANPADYFFMHVLTSEDGNAADAERCVQLVEAWNKSKLRAVMDDKVESMFPPVSPATAYTVAVAHKRKPGGSCIQQFVALLRRGFNDLRRNNMRGRAQIMQAIVFAIIIVLIWNQMSNDQNGVQDRGGVLFFFTANGLMLNIMGVLTTFANERSAMLREQENGFYTTLPYFTSRVLVDIPLKIVGPFIFCCIAYWGVRLQADAGKFFTTVLIQILLALAGNAYGLFLACIFPDVAIALLVAPLFIMPLMMFSGFFLNPDNMPVYLKWVQWISPMKYAFSALAQNEFTGLALYCKPEQLQTFTIPGQGKVQFCPYPAGEEYLRTLRIESQLTITMCCGLLAALAGGFTMLAYFGLLMVTRRSSAAAQGANVVKLSKQ